MTTSALRVRDYMTSPAVTVDEDVEIMRAVRLLIEQRLSGLPVVDHAGRLVGMLTERDCMRVALHAGYHDEPGGPVARYMSSPPRTMHQLDSLLEAAEFFADAAIQHCPVVDDGRVVGLIRRHDTLRALTEGQWFSEP